MRNSVPIALALLGCGVLGCGSDAVDPYQKAADQVASAAAALDEEGGDDMALDGVADSDAAVGDTDDDADEDADEDTDEVAEEAARGDGGVRDGRHHRGDGRGGFGRHPSGRRHGHGIGLLLWYADLAALQVCRDLREECAASADPSLCRDDVHACVHSVFEQAFAALCEDKLAMCEAADAPERACGRIERVCGASDAPATDAGPAPDPMTPDGG